MKSRVTFFDPGFSRTVLRVWLGLCALAKLSDAFDPFLFSHEGNNYALNTTADGDSNTDFICQQFFSAVAKRIQNGTDCGAILAPTANVTEYAVSWFMQHFGGHNMTLLRDASQVAHETFEACTNEVAVNESGPYIHAYNDLQTGTDWIRAFMAVVIAVAALTCLGLGINGVVKCMQSNNDDQQERKNYAPL